jgi:hypothetical protein
MAYREVSGRGALVTFLPARIAGHLSVLANRLTFGRLELRFEGIRAHNIPVLKGHPLSHLNRR